MLKRVKVGETCFVIEGVTPGTSDVEKIILLGFKPNVSANNKNGVFIMVQNGVEKVT